MSENDSNVIRIPPQKYIHILDNNSNLTKLVEGPSTYIKQTHETILDEGIQSMVCLRPRYYCKIRSPVCRNKEGQVEYTSFGQVRVQHGDYEYRTQTEYPDPFSLYPGESMIGQQEKIRVVLKNEAIKLEAVRDLKERKAGEQWHVMGPLSYMPEVGVKIVQDVKCYMIKKDCGLIVQALLPGKCRQGVERHPGEEWLVRQKGLYIPSQSEQIVKEVLPIVLTEKRALQLKAKLSFTDIFKKERLAGQQWLVTHQMTDSHLVDVHEEIVNDQVEDIILFQDQYCVIVNPVDANNKNQWGKIILRTGECQFFLQPHESLESGVQTVQFLTEDKALLLQALQDFKDDEGIERRAGQRWMIMGPRQYCPPIQVEIIEERKSIPLDENEGIYVRNNENGEVTIIKGETYMLKAHESLFEKELDSLVEGLIGRSNSGLPYVAGQRVLDQAMANKRVKSKLVTFKAAHNTAVQLYDYKTKKNRIIFGPDLVQLGPDEHFTLLNLSGGKPKQEKIIQTLSLQLGPDFMTDIFIVETADHAKVSLSLTYSWHFKKCENQQDCVKMFNVKDFVGDACKSIASRIRGSISAIPFETLHYNSSQQIKQAVFGIDKETKEIRSELLFKANNLVITSVDVLNIEITDINTRQCLQQSINLSIEISSKSQEATSRHLAEKMHQQAKGQLERMKLEDLAKAESSQIQLLKLKADSNYVKISGDAIANARARAEANEIEANAQLKNSQLKAQADMIELEQELENQQRELQVEYEQQLQMTNLEIQKKKEMAEIETKKFVNIVNAIGQDTLVAISKAGPEMKAKLLNGLGLKGYLVTDGKNPINLFNTANGFINQK